MEAEFEEHPSTDDLQAFAEGRLDDGKTEEIGVHVEQCNSCAEHVNGLDVDAETVVFESLTPSVTQRMAAEPSANEDSTEGIAVDDRLELQEVIGSGGMGVVYRAWQPNVNRHVAVKQLHIPLPQQDPGSLKSTTRFQREIRALGSVLHPHLARIYSSGITSEGRLFYSMELIDGANLSVIFRELMKRSEQPSQQPSWLAAVKAACTADADIPESCDSAHTGVEHDYLIAVVGIVRQVALAVQALHAAGIVHRDIKPGNIMVNAQGDHATLMDLGLAGLIDETEARLTRTGLIAGSLPYVSPEQFRGEPPSRSGDIYNLGAVLWELLTLQRLFQGAEECSEAVIMHRILHEPAESVRRYRSDVSLDLEAVVLKCLEKQPSRRYSDVGEFVADLDRCLAGQKVAAIRRGTAFNVRCFLKRHQKRIAAGAVLLACQALLVAFFYRRSATAEQPLNPPVIALRATTSATGPASVVAPVPVINDGSLVAYWSGEGTGATARDNSPNGNNGALIGDATREIGAIGNAYAFDGDGDYINFGRSSKWNFLHDGSPFSITGYVAPSPANLDGGILTTIDETSTAANRHGLSVRLDGSRRLESRIQGVGGKFPTGAKSETVLKPDVFTAFGITFDGQTTRLFVNGTLEATGDVVAPFASSTALDALSMGSIGTNSGPNGQPFSLFEGLIDEIQIYNRAYRLYCGAGTC